MDEPEIPEQIEEILNTGFFLAVAALLAFGTLQTAGTVMQTERPVISVVSCSMYPDLNVGDILIVQGTDFEDIEEDDIAVYDVIDQAVLEVNGQQVKLNEENSTYSMNEETLELVDARSNGEQYAVLSLDGERFRINQGEYGNADGVRIGLEYAAGMDIPVVHRVVEKHDNYLETKGDNNPRQIRFEEDVRPEQIYGVSRFRIPRIGGFKLLLMDFMGLNGGKPVVFDTYPVCQES